MVETRRADEGDKTHHIESKSSSRGSDKLKAGSKREVQEVEQTEEVVAEQPPAKRTKPDQENEEHTVTTRYQTGAIERGHIYFFYRPKVQLEEAHTLDDVQRFYILLVPRPPVFAEPPVEGTDVEKKEEPEMTLLSAGADAVPASESTNASKKPFRLIAVGKKSLPDPEAAGGGKGGGRKQIFWATITTVGEDLHKLEEGLGEKLYETKTRGSRHQGPARLVGRGAYAIVNAEAKIPSARETHLGYHLSHPAPESFGDVQKTLGIHPASSFVVQVKNPLAPNTGGVRVGLPKSRRVDYPQDIMHDVFGAGEASKQKRREQYGLKFTSVERKEMLDYEGVELLFIAARSGDAGLETSLGEGRGEALKEVEEKEGQFTLQTVLKELAMDSAKIPAEPLKGEWV